MTPAWLLEGGAPRPWPAPGRAGLAVAAVPAVAGGLVGAGAIVGFRVLAGPPVSDAAGLQRFYTYVWVAAAAGAAITLMLGLLVPRRGVGAGALAGPLASVVAVAGLLAMTVALGGGLNPDFVTSAVRFPLRSGWRWPSCSHRPACSPGTRSRGRHGPGPRRRRSAWSPSWRWSALGTPSPATRPSRSRTPASWTRRWPRPS